MTKLIMTVCYVIEGNRILLGLKKLRLGKGFWNGFSGGSKSGESIEATAARELQEESGLWPITLQEVGIILVTHQDKQLEIELHFFLVDNFEGEVEISDEMIPKWFSADQIPYDEMWPTDFILLPRFLAGKKCIGLFQMKNDSIIDCHKLKEVEELPATFDPKKFEA